MLIVFIIVKGNAISYNMSTAVNENHYSTSY